MADQTTIDIGSSLPYRLNCRVKRQFDRAFKRPVAGRWWMCPFERTYAIDLKKPPEDGFEDCPFI